MPGPEPNYDSEIIRPMDRARVMPDTDSLSRNLFECSGINERIYASSARRIEPDSLDCSGPPYSRDLGTPIGYDAAATRRFRVLSEEVKDGEKRVAKTKVGGKELTAEFERSGGRVQAARFFAPNGKEALVLVRDAATGKLKAEQPLNFDAMKMLTKLGVKIEKDGTINGELDLTAEGMIRYTDQPGSPKRICTFLREDGSTCKIDCGRYTRVNSDANDNLTKLEGWNGRAWVPIRKNDIRESVSADGKTAITSLTFRNPDGSIAKIVDRKVGTEAGNNQNLATFTYPNGSKRTYDWNAQRCRDEKTGKITFKNACGAYTDRPEEGAKPATDGKKTYQKDGCTVTKDREDRIASVRTADAPGAPGKSLVLKYDAHGDVNTVVIGGKTYQRVGAEKNPGMAYKLGRGQGEGAFKAAGRGGKINKWVCKEDGFAGEFNIGVSESGKIMLTGGDGKQKEYDLFKLRDKSAALVSISRDLAAHRREGSDVTVRSPARPGSSDFDRAMTKLIDGGLNGKSPTDVIESMNATQKGILVNELQQKAAKARGNWSANIDALSRDAMASMALSSSDNPIGSLSPEQAAALKRKIELSAKPPRILI